MPRLKGLRRRDDLFHLDKVPSVVTCYPWAETLLAKAASPIRKLVNSSIPPLVYLISIFLQRPAASSLDGSVLFLNFHVDKFIPDLKSAKIGNQFSKRIPSAMALEGMQTTESF